VGGKELPTAFLTITSGATVASFGAVAGFFALYFFSEIPKVRKDIMQVRFIGTVLWTGPYIFS
jgi:hypothetical protein